MKETDRNGKQSEIARPGISRKKRRGKGGMVEGMHQDGIVDETKDMTILKDSVLIFLTKRRRVLPMNEMGIADTDIRTGVEVVSGAEADQESTDESDLLKEDEWSGIKMISSSICCSVLLVAK